MPRSIVDTQEPDPEDDELTTLELERESLKARVRDEIQHGASNFTKLIKRFHDLEERYTKSYIANIINEVRKEIIAELRDRNVEDEVLVFLEENEYMIEEAHAILSLAVENKDRLGALKRISDLRQQRLNFLSYYGALPKGGWEDDKGPLRKAIPDTVDTQKRLQAAREINERTS